MLAARKQEQQQQRLRGFGWLIGKISYHSPGICGIAATPANVRGERAGRGGLWSCSASTLYNELPWCERLLTNPPPLAQLTWSPLEHYPSSILSATKRTHFCHPSEKGDGSPFNLWAVAYDVEREGGCLLSYYSPWCTSRACTEGRSNRTAAAQALGPPTSSFPFSPVFPSCIVHTHTLKQFQEYIVPSNCYGRETQAAKEMLASKSCSALLVLNQLRNASGSVPS